MTHTSPKRGNRYDRTLRAVMWMDAFLSLALVIISVIVSPVFATWGVPHGLLFGLGLAAIGCAVLLASFGGITAVVIMLRLRTGQYLLPVDLRLPLPAPMRPEPRSREQDASYGAVPATTTSSHGPTKPSCES